MTPEGRVKQKVNRVLDEYKSAYRFMPVPGGFGASSLDYLICINGFFLAIETKAPGKKPTDRQKRITAQIHRAGGIVRVIEDDVGCAELRELLEKIVNATHPDFSQT
jgi:hypothetical protein